MYITIKFISSLSRAIAIGDRYYLSKTGINCGFGLLCDARIQRKKAPATNPWSFDL